MGEWGVNWSDVPGHVSYILIALSYWMTNVFWLRVIAVLGLVFEILYFRMSGGAMHTGIDWDIIFIVINLYQLFRLVVDRRRLRYMKELHLLSQGAFASLTREQLAQLVKVGSWRTFESGTQVTREGEPVKELFLICDGQMVVESQGRTITHLHGGSLVGELALVSGSPASATVTTERVTRAFVLEMERLHTLFELTIWRLQLSTDWSDMTSLRNAERPRNTIYAALDRPFLKFGVVEPIEALGT